VHGLVGILVERKIEGEWEREKEKREERVSKEEREQEKITL
jgi:hypothetical protein